MLFSFLLQNLAYEIILTLGQAFEVAYQLALQARKGGHSSTLPESFENKPSKPIPKPRVSIRKSVVSRDDTDILKILSWRERKLFSRSRVMWGHAFLCLLWPPSPGMHPSSSQPGSCKVSGDHLSEPRGSQENSFSVTCGSSVTGRLVCCCFLDESFLKLQASLRTMFSDASLPSHQGPKPLASHRPLERWAEAHSKMSRALC